MDLQEHLDLVDWRRQVGDAYRLGSVDAWRAARERLFREHPQSPVPPPARAAFAGLRWFPVDNAYRVPARPAGEPTAGAGSCGRAALTRRWRSSRMGGRWP